VTIKDEALNAIQTARTMLDAGRVLSPLDLTLLKSTLDFAHDRVERLTVARPKRAKDPTTEEESST